MNNRRTERTTSMRNARESSLLSYFTKYLPCHHNEKSGIYYWPVFGVASRSPGARKSIYAKYFDANRLGGDVASRDGRFIETGSGVLGQFYWTLSTSPHTCAAGVKYIHVWTRAGELGKMRNMNEQFSDHLFFTRSRRAFLSRAISSLILPAEVLGARDRARVNSPAHAKAASLKFRAET